MIQITVSDELARAISQAGPFVTLLDSNGTTVGQVAPPGSQLRGPIGISDEYLAELERIRAEDDGKRYSWAEVKEHLRSLAPE
ncbi:MAG TPA: hypothetical protein VFW73_11180 [Lacipirellulaceae bacterium]|nr:hypothetical protein [Lacipirellulaceae bacterium]